MKFGYLKALATADQKVNPFFTFLGARLTLAHEGVAEIRLPVTMDLIQGAGLVAGGIVATLADEAMGHAVISRLEDGRRTVTVEMNVRYLRPGRPEDGGELLGRGTVLKFGRNIATTEASVFDTNGKLLATAGGTFWLFPEDADAAAKDRP